MNQDNQDEIVNNNINNNTSSTSNSLLVYCILLMIIVFIFIEILELVSNINFLIKTVSIANSLNSSLYFNRCIKYPLLFKICYTIYSLSASLSSACLLIIIMADLLTVCQKIGYTFIQFNYFMFGPLLCALTSSALFYYDKTMIICSNNDIRLSQLSPGLLTNTITFLAISIMIILVFEGYESINYTVDSILNKPNSNEVIHYLFWRTVNGRVLQSA